MSFKIRLLCTTSIVLLNLLVYLPSTVSCKRHTAALSAKRHAPDPRCCFPDMFHGELSFSSGFSHRSDHTTRPSRPPPRKPTLKFAVDFRAERVYGEHFSGGGARRPRHFTFVSDLRKEIIVIRERLAKRCWKLRTEARTSGRCLLDDAKYQAKVHLRQTSGLLFSLKHSSNEDTAWLHYRSVMLVASDTCLPVLDINHDELDQFVSFRGMKHGLGELARLDLLEACDNYESNTNDGSSSKDDDGSDALPEELYLYLLSKFFPRAPPTPCCGPLQWQASLVKSISYTNSKDNVIGESVTSVPSMYVDHETGQMAALILEYVNNEIASNITFISIYGSTLLTIYTVEWNKSPPDCTIFKVTGVNTTMRSTCMPASAQYVTTVRFGDGLLDSTRLDVWNVSQVDGSFNFSSEMFVDPRSCMTIMEEYTWASASTEKVQGTITLSNVQTSISDPAAAFAIPGICNNETPISITYDQALSAFSSVLAYGGLL